MRKLLLLALACSGSLLADPQLPIKVELPKNSNAGQIAKRLLGKASAVNLLAITVTVAGKQLKFEGEYPADIWRTMPICTDPCFLTVDWRFQGIPTTSSEVVEPKSTPALKAGSTPKPLTPKAPAQSAKESTTPMPAPIVQAPTSTPSPTQVETHAGRLPDCNSLQLQSTKGGDGISFGVMEIRSPCEERSVSSTGPTETATTAPVKGSEPADPTKPVDDYGLNCSPFVAKPMDANTVPDNRRPCTSKEQAQWVALDTDHRNREQSNAGNGNPPPPPPPKNSSFWDNPLAMFCLTLFVGIVIGAGIVGGCWNEWHQNHKNQWSTAHLKGGKVQVMTPQVVTALGDRLRGHYQVMQDQEGRAMVAFGSDHKGKRDALFLKSILQGEGWRNCKVPKRQYWFSPYYLRVGGAPDPAELTRANANGQRQTAQA